MRRSRQNSGGEEGREREESEIGGPLSEIESSLPRSLARLLTRLAVAAEPPPHMTTL